MTELEFIKELVNAKKNGNKEKAFLMKGKWGKRNYRTFGGVKGEIIAEYPDDMLLVVFPVDELLNAVAKQLPRYTRKKGENHG